MHRIAAQNGIEVQANQYPIAKRNKQATPPPPQKKQRKECGTLVKKQASLLFSKYQS